MMWSEKVDEEIEILSIVRIWEEDTFRPRTSELEDEEPAVI